MLISTSSVIFAASICCLFQILIFLQIERVAKLVIPLAFLAFNLAYWPVVLVKYFDGR